MPVHVIGAEHDILVPVWKSRELAELIPDAQLTVIERAPHGAHVERAEEFNRPCSTSSPSDASRAGRPSRSACASAALERLGHMGAARSNSTISSTRATGSPARATTRSSCGGCDSRRTRPNSIAMPLESMKLELAEVDHERRAPRWAPPRRSARRVHGAPGDVELAGHARDHHARPLLDLEPDEPVRHRAPPLPVRVSAAAAP